jgi:hypothetical protein
MDTYVSHMGHTSHMPRTTIERIVAMRMRECLCPNMIANMLNAEGVPGPNGGSAWCSTAVRRVLAQEGIS